MELQGDEDLHHVRIIIRKLLRRLDQVLRAREAYPGESVNAPEGAAEVPFGQSPFDPWILDFEWRLRRLRKGRSSSADTQYFENHLPTCVQEDPEHPRRK